MGRHDTDSWVTQTGEGADHNLPSAMLTANWKEEKKKEGRRRREKEEKKK